MEQGKWVGSDNRACQQGLWEALRQALDCLLWDAWRRGRGRRGLFDQIATILGATRLPIALKLEGNRRAPMGDGETGLAAIDGRIPGAKPKGGPPDAGPESRKLCWVSGVWVVLDSAGAFSPFLAIACQAGCRILNNQFRPLRGRSGGGRVSHLPARVVAVKHAGARIVLFVLRLRPAPCPLPRKWVCWAQARAAFWRLGPCR